MRVTRTGTGRAASFAWTLSAVAWLAGLAGAQETVLVRTKQVAALPADIEEGLVRLPEIGSVRERSRGAWWPLEAERGADGVWRHETELALEREGALALAVVGLGAERWTLEAREPGGAWQPLVERVARGEATRRSEALEGALAGLVLERFDLERAPAGAWRVRVSAPASERARPEGLLLARGVGEARLESWITTPAQVADEPLGIAAELVGGTLESATLVLETARGGARIPMEDTGLALDGAAGDGVFGALVPGLSGEVRARVELRGRDAAGAALVRTTQHALVIVERAALLTGELRTRLVDARRMAIELGAWELAPAKLQLAAELWGTSPSGSFVPVTWLARMVVPEADEAGRAWLELVLDARWLDRAGALAPLELRRVRLVDPDTQAVFDQAERIALPPGPLPPLAGRPGGPVTRDMLAATAAPIAIRRVGDQAPAGSFQHANGLMLVHGWCSSGGIWPEAHFSEPKLQFVDPSANRTNDQFALLLSQFGASRLSFGILAHSQGGMAALHLYTYYASGLDQAVGPRRIQTVATPWLGTPLAAFGGLGCGQNADLTTSGASAWLAGIPSWARAEVSYWTTSNSGSACNPLSDFFLANPEDGVVEQFRGQLSGGDNRGHVVGWCHSTGMKNPANYLDAARNAERDAQAAR